VPSRVKDAAVVQELQPGDKITAEVIVSKDGNDYWLEDVRITDESGRGQVKPQAAPRMLTPGERVPDVALINQDGRTIHLSEGGRCDSGGAEALPFRQCRAVRNPGYVVPVALSWCWVFPVILYLRSQVAGVAPRVPSAPSELIARALMEAENEWK
jgi:hypothetical protein